MKKLFLFTTLLVFSICTCFAIDAESETAYAISPDSTLTLKYNICSQKKGCFIKFRLITGSTDVWKEGDELTFTCKDGTKQSITCNNNLDDNNFHIVYVKTPVFAHMLTGITAIRLSHQKQEINMRLLEYTSSKTRNGVKLVEKCFQKNMADSILNIKKNKIDSLFHIASNIKLPKFDDFSYIKGCLQTSAWARKEIKTLSKPIKHDFYFAWDEYRKKKAQNR